MKKIISIILAVMFVVMLASCGETPVDTTAETTLIETTSTTATTSTEITTATDAATTEATAEATTEATTELTTEATTESTVVVEPESDYVSGVETVDKYVSYVEMQTIVEAKREIMYSPYIDFSAAESYFPKDSLVKDLLTAEELATLNDKNNKADGSKVITYSEAAADIDLYFRFLKYAYAPYVYFGGDKAFEAAQDAILDEMSNYETLSGYQIGDIVIKHLSFIIDRHFNFRGKTRAAEEDYAYKYAYCNGQIYALDENGYYKLIDGEKWYYAGCENEDVFMDFSLDRNGNIVYSLVRFCPSRSDGKAVQKTDDIFLTKGAVTKKQTVKWIDSANYDGLNTIGIDYKYFKENGVEYISVRSYSNDSESETATMEEYIASGVSAKKAKVLILDLRSNGGGYINNPLRWIQNFTGKYSNSFGNGIWIHKTNGTISKEYFKGSRIDNDIPIILLVDNTTFSAGELFLVYLCSLKNVTVIGSNTGGCVLGSVSDLYLPNSGISGRYTNSMIFHYEVKNMDGIGYSPDIWCNPKNALDVAFRFIETSGLAQKDAVDAMRTHFPEVKTDLITLRFNDGTVEKTSSEIISNMGTVAEVYFDGEHITDFEITSSSTYATIDNDGEKIRLIPAQSGKIYKFRVHYDGRYAEFFWRTP